MSHDVPLFLATFLASGVEAVEALTIVLAVGVVHGWRSPLPDGTARLASVLLRMVLRPGPIRRVLLASAVLYLVGPVAAIAASESAGRKRGASTVLLESRTPEPSASSSTESRTTAPEDLLATKGWRGSAGRMSAALSGSFSFPRMGAGLQV